ncbi:hypothetical protein [Micromonospora sp. NPDC050495]|uniref:hypothetical protein n=1 Tax=Micromonospora sp. NPDC050495 TaxID=3154936 RepID=UPI0033C79B9F
MKDKRSGTQVLYGLLPEQTADLQGGIWKTVEWRDPIKVDVDEAAIRQRLETEILGWTRDVGAVHASRTLDVEVVKVNDARGVKVERYPEIYICRHCRRIEFVRDRTCVCGQKSWQQSHFVGYHECGRLEAPRIPRCERHNQVRMEYQPTIDASKILFKCPICQTTLQRGFSYRRCPCGRRWPQRDSHALAYTVHRSASVYAPQSFVLINPGTKRRIIEITESGGPRRALTWVLNGMREDRPSERQHTTSSLIDQLVASGVSRAVAEQMAGVAASHGELTSEDDLGTLAVAPHERLLQAEREAVDLALATFDGRVRVPDLISDGVPVAVRDRYTNAYPEAMRRAGLETVELADRFPVMRAVYGFTRGGTVPGAVNLNLFSGKRGRRVYADPQQSEALMFRLNPTLIARWLRQRGHDLPTAPDDRGLRAAIASAIDLPDRFNEHTGHPTPGSDLLTLVHSYAHRVIRQLSVFAGVDRESLGEYLLPSHGVFFVFAAARGDFVLGGLQAVFENDLQTFLDAVVNAEHRCPLDPACERNGGACHACAHLGEPVCGHFNRYLGRGTLFGPTGYLGQVS